MVRKPEMTAEVKEKFLSGAPQYEPVPASPVATSPSGSIPIRSPIVASPLSNFLPADASSTLKADLEYTDPKGFGQWKIYMSERARRDLRKHCKGNPDFVKIVKSKLA